MFRGIIYHLHADLELEQSPPVFTGAWGHLGLRDIVTHLVSSINEGASCLDYSIAFQWHLSPWFQPGRLRPTLKLPAQTSPQVCHRHSEGYQLSKPPFLVPWTEEIGNVSVTTQLLKLETEDLPETALFLTPSMQLLTKCCSSHGACPLLPVFLLIIWP